MKPASRRLCSAAPFAGVVLLLGIGVAVIGPRIARAARQSNDALLCESLRYFRTEIRVYTDEHQNVAPGYAAIDEQMTSELEFFASISDDIPSTLPAADAEVFVRQLTQFTDAQGHVSSNRSESCDRGPYMIAVPQNPITLKADVQVVDQAEMPATDESKPYGWIYNARTKRLIANVAGVDSGGVRYANY